MTKSSQVIIDESLFAHINNDPFLSGSFKLQGHTFQRTIGYLNQYISQLPQANIPEDVKKLLRTCNTLVDYQSDIDSIRSSLSGLPELANKIHADIQKLKGDEYLLMPGGWLTGNGGHAIVYQYSLDDEGNLLFSINNSGSGLEFHGKKSEQHKELYNPVLTYRIPKDRLGENNLASFIEETIKLQIPQLHKKSEIGPDYLYQRVFPLLSYVKGEIIHCKDEVVAYWYTGGQLSGTCAQRSLHQMLKSRFASLDEYRQFIYGFKMHALEDYLSQPGVLEATEQHDLIVQSIKHNLRLLNLDESNNPGTSLFSQDEKTTGQGKLLGFLTQCNHLKPLPTQMPVLRMPLVTLEPSTVHVLFRHQIYPVKLGKVADKPREDVTLPIILTEDQDLLAHMDEVLKRCDDLGMDQDQALLEQLECFFLNIPLPENTSAPLLKTYSVIDSEAKACAFYQKMTHMQILYFDTCQRLINKDALLPRMYLVKMSAFSVIAHVNSNLPMTSTGTCYHDFLEKKLSGYLQQTPDQAYIANNDPQRDDRYKHICALYKPSNLHLSADGKEVVFYYRSLLENATKGTTLKTLLEEKYLERYKNDNSQLHDVLRTEQCTALYYFLEHLEELKSDSRFQRLIDTFKLQLEMEKAYSSTSGQFFLWKYSHPYQDVLKIEIGLAKFGNELVVASSPAQTNDLKLRISDALLDSKYRLQRTAAALAQERDSNQYINMTKRRDNHTQLLPGIYAGKCVLNEDTWYDAMSSKEKSSLTQRQINATDLEERELFHLRRYAPSQIKLTLDYFNCHLEKCADSTLRSYVEANLFQPGLLAAELTPEQAPLFLEQFDTFITNGLAFYEKKGQLTQSSLFFIRLASQVYQYAGMVDSKRLGDRLESFYQRVNQFLQSTDNSLIKSSLHQYRFLTVVAQMKLNPDYTAHLDNALLSYFQLQVTQNPYESLDTDSRIQLQCAKHQMVRCLNNHQNIITPHHVPAILNALNIVVDEGSCVLGHYPVYDVQCEGNVTYTVDMERGLVFKDDMAYSTLPLDIIGHPVMKQLGLQGLSSCFVSADGKMFLIDKPPLELRFVKNSSTYVIQKKWLDNEGNLSWYKLLALTEAQNQGLQLGCLDNLTGGFQKKLRLSETIKERDSLAWAHCDKDELLITDANHQPWYCGTLATTNYNSHWLLTDVQKQAVLCTQDTWIHHRLSSLESPDFITVVKQGNDYIAMLARYGLQFAVDGSSKSIQMDWEGNQYSLQDISSPTWGEGITHLKFGNGKQDICVLPIQQFINTDLRDKKSAYYLLEQDTQAKIAHSVIEKLIKKKDKAQLWQYSGTEQCLTLKMSKGEPVPQSAAEAIYLCYVYLGNNQPEKAWAILEDCDKRLGGLAGTYDEIRYLSWIIEALPRNLTSEDKAAVISNPPLVACKLKALALLAGFSRQDKSIVFPEPSQDESTVNGLYERHTINEVKTFYNKVNEQIYALFSRMQGMRREMPVNFTLSDVACKQLLAFYHDHLSMDDGKPKAVGAMGYEWVRLHLITLRQEHTYLLVKARMDKLSPYDVKRKQDIEDCIEKHEGVAKVQSDLEYIAVNLNLSDDVDLNTSLLSQQLINLIYTRGAFAKLVVDHHQQETAINALILSITEEEFINNFTAYLAIASTNKNQFRKQLSDFCESTLIAHRHVPLNKQINNVPLLCNVLYRILSSNLKLPSNIVDQNSDCYKDLLVYAKTLSAPEIKVPQLIDTTKELLMTAQDLWKSIPEPSIAVIPEILLTELTIKPFEQTLSPELTGIMERWRAEERRFHTGEHIQTQSIPEASVLASEEYIVGEVKYQALGNLKYMASSELNDQIINDLAQQTRQSLFALTAEQEQLSETILVLAKNGPEDLDLKQQWQIDVGAGKRVALDIPQLLTLYFHQDTTLYKTKTGLSDSSIKQLHTLLTNYVNQGLRVQQHQRVQTQLERFGKAHTSSDQAQARFLLAQALFTENLVTIDDPVLSLFQLHGDILLRPQQIAALGRLLKTSSEDNYTEAIEKIIMGGGKSKVILPTLAQKKATGNNLVVIEVPRALLRTNFIDLKSTSNTLFNQTAYTFEFTRDSDCSAMRLEQLYNDLTDVMVNKNYLVTTGDALQSLELKYLELLLTPPDTGTEPSIKTSKIIANWENQVLWADKLVSLFRNRADLMIDEVHQGLLLKNKLNFTVGESGKVPTFIIQNSVELYQFFKRVNLDGNITLDDVLKRNSLLVDHHQFELACKQLAYELVHHEQSPLASFIKTIDAQSASELLLYLQNTGPKIPDCVLNATPDVREKLALYKQQVSHFLPHTLKRNHGEHYGASKSMKHGPETRALAIPYLANNVPNERSRFENSIETTNYTIQSLLISGIDRDLIRSVLNEWQIQAGKELYKQRGKTIDDMSTALLFSELTQGLNIPFSQLDLKDEDQLTQLHIHLKSDERLIYELLKTNVLKHIRTDPSILHSDASNHVDIVRSCQGMSGTPWNHSTFHQRLHYDSESAMGTDGYIYSGIKSKTPALRNNDFKDKDQFVNNLLANYQALDQVRAIIDISATFKGLENEAVAKSLAQYIHQHPHQFNHPKSLQYVLYFNTDNQLSALRIGEDIASQTSIIIGPSDPDSIKDRLSCDPEECFSYYDQSHTVGADLKQAEQARGLVLVDHDTTLDSFLQGSMRMRGLIEGEQRIDMIVPTKLADQTLEQLMTSMGNNQQRQLQQDNFEAARSNMINLVRADLMRRVLMIHGDDAASRKVQMLALFKSFFIENQSDDFFRQYGGLTREYDTKDLLASLHKQLIDHWITLLQSANGVPTNDELTKMSKDMTRIVHQACEPGVCAAGQMSSNASMNREVEVQKQVHVDVFIEKEMEKEMFDSQLVEAEYMPWNMITVANSSYHRWLSEFFVPRAKSELGFKTLTSICSTTGARNAPVFSDQIKASRNFYQSYAGQKKYVGMFLKPVHALYFTRVDGKLSCSILTQQESQELKPLINQTSDCWISTTQHTELAGKIPDNVRNTLEYQEIIEQIRYFNGEFSLFLQQDATHTWLDQQSREKLDFFEEHLSVCRETLPSYIKQLSSIFSINKEVYQFIAESPTINRDHFDWKSRFPDCFDAEINGYRAVAKAFNDVAANWDEPDLATKQWECPLSAVSFINQYIEKITALKSLLKGVQDYFEQSPKPASIAGLLDKTQRQAFPQYVLNDDSMSVDLCDFNLLMNLIKEIPSLKDHSAILSALSEERFKPYITVDAPILDNISLYADKLTAFESLMKGVQVYSEQYPTPASIVTSFDENQRQAFHQYMPNADSVLVDLRDYNLLTQLIAEVPSSTAQAGILSTLFEARFIPFLNINDEDLKKMAKRMLDIEFTEPKSMGNKVNESHKLCSSIDELRLKALEFISPKGMGRNEDMEGFKATFSLYVLINQATTNYSEGKTKPEDFERVITESINRYKPALNSYGNVLGVLINILNLVVLNTNKMIGTKFIEFKTRAQALKIIEDIEKHITKSGL